MRILLREDVISIDENLGTVPDNLDPTPKRFAMDEDLRMQLVPVLRWNHSCENFSSCSVNGFPIALWTTLFMF